MSTYDLPTRFLRSETHRSQGHLRIGNNTSNPFSNPLDSLRRKLTARDKNRNASVSSKSAEAQSESNANLSPSHPSMQPPSTNYNTSPSTTANPEAPPPYSPAPAASSNAQQITLADQGENDPFHFLRSFDTVFVSLKDTTIFDAHNLTSRHCLTSHWQLIDDSGSMAGSRWTETRDALKTITPTCTAYDADGIDIFFLNSRDTASNHNITSAALVEQVFNRVRPSGVTPTGQRLHAILEPYLDKYKKAAKDNKPKPMNLICITDGVPTDDVEGPLIQAARRLDKMNAPAWQVGVQFFQVGRDKAAREHLQTLDDDLESAAGKVELRDMVDTVPFTDNAGARLTGDGILKVVLGGVNRRQDRKTKDIHR